MLLVITSPSAGGIAIRTGTKLSGGDVLSLMSTFWNRESFVRRWWVGIPAVLRRYSALLAVAWSDGRYIVAWPRLAQFLPLLALAFGLFEGATHWAPAPTNSWGFNLIETRATTFAQIAPLLCVSVVLGALSANLGLTLVLGYAVGDILIGGLLLQHSFFDGPMRVAQLISYLLFYALAVQPTLISRALAANPAKMFRRFGFLADLVELVITVLVQGGMVYTWTLSAQMAIRPLWSWAHNSPPIIFQQYQNATVPWLPLLACAAAALRCILVLPTRKNAAVRELVSQSELAFREADQHPAFSRRLPLEARLALIALAITLLAAGYFSSLLLAVIVFLIITAILMVRARVLPQIPIWQRWGETAQKIPLVLRWVSIVPISIAITQTILALPGQAVLVNSIPGSFGAEIISLILGLTAALALFPESAKPTSLPRPGAGVRTATIAGMLFLAFTTQGAGAECLDPVCCFGTTMLAVLAVAGLVVVFAGLLALAPEVLPLMGELLAEEGSGMLIAESTVEEGAAAGEVAAEEAAMEAGAEPLGVNLSPLTDKFGNFASRAAPIPGYTDVVIHGNLTGFALTPTGELLTPQAVAQLIQTSADYTGGAIRLISCSTGAPGATAAQALATELGVNVLAPTNTVWAFANGALVVGATSSGVGQAVAAAWKLFFP